MTTVNETTLVEEIKHENISEYSDIEYKTYKTYKTIDEQIEYFKENKKIIIDNEHRFAFQERNYSSIINLYKEFFCSERDEENKHVYNNATRGEEVIKLNKIDDYLCQNLYSLIGVFEKKIKSVLFNELCFKYINCEENKKDIFCIQYITEIKDFIITQDDEKLPRFCENFRFTASKKNKYSVDSYLIDPRIDTLISLYEEQISKRN